MRSTATSMTPSQRRVYDAIVELTALKFGKSPSIRQIAARLCVTPNGVQECFVALCETGYLRRSGPTKRLIEILLKPEVVPVRKVNVPLLGLVAAGYPVAVDEHVIGNVQCDANAVGKTRCFALRVTGESMVDADIFDGDIIVVRQQPVAQSGEIVVAAVDGDVTVKKLLFKKDGSIELKPANKDFRTIRIVDSMDCRILGKVIEVQHI